MRLIFMSYQLPDAPPPPKLPPPPLNPPLSLELLLSLLPDPPEYEPEYEPPPPDRLPLLPRPAGDAASANSAMMKTITARRIDTPSDPAMNHASNPTTPPVVTAPINLPSVARRMAPRITMPKRTKGFDGSIWLSKPGPCRGAGAGSFSPSMTRMIRL